MKIGIMQPYIFPYIGYWQLINKVDYYVIYDDVNFIKGGWINRNSILMNNEAKLISIQMQGSSPNKLINEIQVSPELIWRKKFIKTIENCYSKAPFYNEVFPIIRKIIMNDEINLAKYLEYSIKQICEYLGIKTKIIISSEIDKNNALKGQDKVIDICKRLNGDEYYNAIGGQELYSYEEFFMKNIKLKFIRTKKIAYKQFSNECITNLSIIDIMMFNSVDEIKYMLSEYEVITNE